MNKLGILIKNSFNCMVGTLNGKRNRKSTQSMVMLLLLAGVGIFALYYIQNRPMIKQFCDGGIGQIGLFHGYFVTFFTIIILGVMRVTGSTKTNDMEMLLAMPISKKDIAISKTLSKYAFDFFFTFVLLAPILIMYQIYCGFSIVQTIIGIISLLILPLFSVGISNILDFFMTRYFNKMKNANFIKSIISIAIFMVVLITISVTTTGYGALLEGGSINTFMNQQPIAKLFVLATINPGINILWILCICIIPFTIGIMLYSFNIGKTFNSYHGNSSVLKYNNNRGQFGTFLGKEFRYYINTPAYLINTLIGPLLIILFTCFMCIKGQPGLETLFGMPIDTSALFLITILIFMALTFMCLISCSSISLEGRSLWLLKSTPINLNKLFWAKICVNILMVSPVIIVCAVATSLCFKFTLLQFILLVVCPVLLNLIVSIGGLLINLWLPKMEWDNETQVVKSSLSTLVTMLLGFACTVIPVVIYLIDAYIDIYLLAGITSGLYLLVVVALIIVLSKKGKRLFDKI